MIKNLQTKLVLLCSVILLFVVFVGVIGVYQIMSLNKSYTYLINNRSQMMGLAKTLVGDFEYNALYLRTYLLTGHKDYLDIHQTALAKSKKVLEDIKKMTDDNKSKELAAAIEKDLAMYTTYAAEVIELKHKGTMNDVIDFTLNRRGTIQSIVKNANTLADHQAELMHMKSLENDKKVVDVRNSLIAAIVFSIIFGLVIATAVSRTISGPIVLLEQESARMADGKINGKDIAIKSTGEVSRLVGAFNLMRNNLRSVVGQVLSSSEQLAMSVQHLSAMAQQTNSSAKESAATISQMAKTVEQVAGGAYTVAQASKEASELAERGNTGIDQIMLQMKKQGEVSEEVSRVVSKLNASTTEISQIVDIITGIADQTNLLSLNAAIEAARAGEQGRGFAVVADEVRKLAEQSSASAKEIYSLINGVQSEAERSVQVMNMSRHEFETAQKVINEVGAYFKDIIAKVQDLGTQMQDVAAASQEMSAGIQSISGVTEEQTAAVGKISELAQELQLMGDNLENVAKKFTV